MDTSFLEYLLLMVLVGLLVLFLYQSHRVDKMANIAQTISMKPNDTIIPVIIDTCPNSDSRIGTPVHHIGPVLNFHQKFKPELPELGWRNFYLNNYTKTLPENDTNFEGTPIREYLDNMENVKNLYREC